MDRMEPLQTVRWSPCGDAVRIVDQRHLPAQYLERDLRTVGEICDAIRTLAVRGAPAIGICGAMGIVAAMQGHELEAPGAFRDRLRGVASEIREARPTAVNLSWAVDRVMSIAGAVEGTNSDLLEALRAEASTILAEDRAMCEMIGTNGRSLLFDGARILTHCNAGALATGGIGTALAPLYRGARDGLRFTVFADETRPLFQGSRLTSWELARAGIPVTVIADNVAASLMRAGAIDLCLVGADRIAANGDVANKIGTYGVAVLARHHGLPFYVAAPTSTIDAASATGAAIPIEERGREEVSQVMGTLVVPNDAAVYNPAFDVTPAGLVTAIVTDQGVYRGPYDFSRVAGGGGPPH